MNQRVVEISDQGQHLSLYRGFLIVEKENAEKGRVPLDDISVLLVFGYGNSISTNVINALLERNVVIVLCNEKQNPSGMIWPMDQHHIQGLRLRMQIDCSLPLKKRLWQCIIRQKIAMQSAVLNFFNQKDEGLLPLSAQVLSGDPQNLEAQAAKRYWKALFGNDFRRDKSGGDVNGMLNYGYAILRGGVARAVAATGLHPTLGIFHNNYENPFCLVDDLMEPFRPLVDFKVKLLSRSVQRVTTEVKRELASLLATDFTTRYGRSPLSTCLLYLSRSLVQSFESKEVILDFPINPLAVVWGDTEKKQI